MHDIKPSYDDDRSIFQSDQPDDHASSAVTKETHCQHKNQDSEERQHKGRRASFPAPFPDMQRSTNQHGKTFLFSEDEAIQKLPSIEKMIKGLSSLPTYKRTLDDEFIEKPITHGDRKGTTAYSIRSDSRFQQVRSAAQTLLSLRKNNYSLSHHAHAFLSHFAWCYMEEWDKNINALRRHQAEDAIFYLEKSIASLNNEVKGDDFKVKVKNSRETARQRAKSLRVWMRKAFRQSPSLLWIQLQLGHKLGPGMPFEQSIKDRNAFLEKRRHHSLFRHLVGHVYKLHFHPTKGIVHDIILVYDANVVRESASLTQALKEYWEKITWDSQIEQCHGVIWEDNPQSWLRKKDSRTPPPDIPTINGVWSLNTKEDKQRLQRVIYYLSYYDTLLGYHLPKNTRALNMSRFPAKKKKKKELPSAPVPIGAKNACR